MAVAGTGPAGLMAAQGAAEGGLRVAVFEKRPSAGRKLLIAGSSGLNVTFDLPLGEAESHFVPADRMRPFLRAFPPAAWLSFVERLGVKTFRGTSRRWFVEGMKTPPLLAAWMTSLRARGVTFTFERECCGFESREDGVALRFTDGSRVEAAAAVLCLGGASWEKSPSSIPGIFERQGLTFEPFRASNAGFQVPWPAVLLAEAEGKPVKNVVLTSSRGSRAGDLVITAYGLEGTPVYAVGEVETVHIDLKPDLKLEQVVTRLRAPRENLSPMRRAKRTLKLGEGGLALLYHLAPPPAHTDIDALAAYVKALPVTLQARQPLEEAISSAGGLSWDELDDTLMLKRAPGIFAAGEMIDWDAPTGGFLVQGCVSSGWVAGRSAGAWVEHRTS